VEANEKRTMINEKLALSCSPFIFNCSLFIYLGVYQMGEVTFGCECQIPSNNRPDTPYRSAVRSCNPRCLFPSYQSGEKTDRSANRKRLPLLWRRTPRALSEVWYEAACIEMKRLTTGVKKAYPLVKV
jgi:hypothetical protein